MSNRRDWLKATSLGALSLGLGQFETFAKPVFTELTSIADNRILLRSNENPYGPSLLAQQAMIENINNSNRYGWNITSQLIEELSKKNNLSPENILLGAGSTELLDLIFKLSSQKTGSYILADPTYAYWASAKTSNFERIIVPLTKDKKYRILCKTLVKIA